MKRERLLEAIGGVDEQLLIEAEKPACHCGRNVRRFVLVAAIITALSITVAASTGILTGLLKGADNGSTVDNLSTGMGSFVYSDGSIYCGEPGYIYQYDTQGNLIKAFALGAEQEIPMYMFATEDAIIYVDSFMGLKVLPKDGAEVENVLADVSMTSVYVDGTQLYTTDGAEMLTQINLSTGEETQLLENVSAYYIDDTYIYAVQSGEGEFYHRSQKDNIAFEKIALPFTPNKVIADGQDLYFCQWVEEDLRDFPNLRYQVNLVRNGKATSLPVYSWFYQVLDGWVIYREEETYHIKAYNVETGETKMIAENAFEFAVLEGRYICIDQYGVKILYDWDTEERIVLEK